MDFEKMQSTIEFLLQQQAKHDLMMSELHECRKILTALVQKQSERLDSDNNQQSLPAG